METTTLSKSQATVIAKLRNDREVEDLSADPAATIRAMDARYSYSSTRVALGALNKLYPDCRAFKDEARRRKDVYKSMDTAQEPTAKQVDKFVPWPQLLEFRDSYRDRLSDTEYLLLCLYTMIPPVRADWTPMRVVTRKPRQFQEGLNYMVILKSSIVVYWRAYKTHKVYGDKVQKLPANLCRVIREYRMDHPTEYLLQNDDGSPWSEDKLSASVRRPFERFHGMRTGISMIRHSYATHVYKGMPSTKSLERTAGSMHHSVMQGQGYRFLELE